MNFRYEDIPGFEDIVAGAGGSTNKSEDAVNFLTFWSDWFVEIINTIVQFFKEMGEMFNK